MGTTTGKLRFCSYCRDKALIPGILFPFAPDGDDSHAYVERCDECAVFSTDEDAAMVLAVYLRKLARWTKDGRYVYLVGIDFFDAQKLKRQPYVFR